MVICTYICLKIAYATRRILRRDRRIVSIG
jgi:hypothetical protein